MQREEIIEKLTPLVRKAFEDPTLELADGQSAENVESWTSLAFMKLLSDIEQEFGFKFKMMELLSLKNMGNIIDAISRH